jgi:hypothetical protein
VLFSVAIIRSKARKARVSALYSPTWLACDRFTGEAVQAKRNFDAILAPRPEGEAGAGAEGVPERACRGPRGPPGGTGREGATRGGARQARRPIRRPWIASSPSCNAGPRRCRPRCSRLSSAPRWISRRKSAGRHRIADTPRPPAADSRDLSGYRRRCPTARAKAELVRFRAQTGCFPRPDPGVQIAGIDFRKPGPCAHNTSLGCSSR